MLVLGIISFVATPIENTLTRVQEYEADIFGLNTARQPDGFAEAALILGEYRKLDPTPLEELIFFGSPQRPHAHFCRDCARWKAENQCISDAVNPCPTK